MTDLFEAWPLSMDALRQANFRGVSADILITSSGF